MWNFVAEKQLFSLFFFVVSAANLQRCQKSINDFTPTSDTPSLGYRRVGTNSLTSCLRFLTKRPAVPQQLYKTAAHGLSAIAELLVTAPTALCVLLTHFFVECCSSGKATAGLILEGSFNRPMVQYGTVMIFMLSWNTSFSAALRLRGVCTIHRPSKNLIIDAAGHLF